MAKYGFYENYNGCKVNRQRSCWVAINEHGGTIKCCEDLQGCHRAIDLYQQARDHSGVILRATAEKLSEEQVKKIALGTLNHKGFTSYIYKDFNGTFEELNCNTYFNGKVIDYITNPDYVVGYKYKLNLELYTKYVRKQLREKTFKLSDLKIVKSYKDFKNKLDYVWNILVQTFTSATIFYINEKDKPIVYPYKALTRTFKNKEDAILCAELNKSVQALHFQKMQEDDDYLESACVYEFYNHETPYDWDGLDPALNAIGLSEKSLNERQRKIVNRAYKKVIANGNW